MSKEQMKLQIFEYIEIWYIQKRRHLALKYMTIKEFNNQINIKMSLNLSSAFYLHIQY